MRAWLSTVGTGLVVAETSRAVVLVLYLMSFACALGLTFHAVYIAVAASPHASDDLLKVIDVYSVPLAIAIAGAVAMKPTAPSALSPSQTVLLYGSTLIWNAWIILEVLYFNASQGDSKLSAKMSSQSFIDALTLAKDHLAFLVSGILAYVYASK